MDNKTFLAIQLVLAVIWDIVCLVWATYLVFFHGVGVWIYLVAFLLSHRVDLYKQVKLAID